MNLLDRLLKILRRKEKRKYISVYISEKWEQLIIAPRFEDERGVIFEQEKCLALDFPLDNAVLGRHMKECLDLYYYKNEVVNVNKKSDWPAYKTSKCKTIKAFEKEYIYINIEIIMRKNLYYTLEAYPNPNINHISVNTIVSFYCEDGELGKEVITVYKACKKLL